NQNYVGPYPDKKYYGYDSMTKQDKQDFDSWHESIKDKTFDFKQEMYKYCKSDVDILRRGCLKLRELFIQISNIDPFQYITIASVCQAIYRNEYLPSNTIGIVNETPMDNYSIKSLKWLKYISLNENINIRHACNGGEYSLNIHTRYNLKTICEHDYDQHKEMKSAILNVKDVIEPPKIRDSFFGGRCEPIKLLYNFKDKNLKGRYIDVVSLYPTVMYYDEYPTGHPTKIIKPQAYDKNWFGFIYCKILPPRGLYQPVLPYKQKTKQTHKLLFGLCRTCMQNIDYKCNHHKNKKCDENCSKTNCIDCKSARK